MAQSASATTSDTWGVWGQYGTVRKGDDLGHLLRDKGWGAVAGSGTWGVGAVAGSGTWGVGAVAGSGTWGAGAVAASGTWGAVAVAATWFVLHYHNCRYCHRCCPHLVHELQLLLLLLQL